MTVAVRPATADDSRRIWEWRNDPATRAMSATTGAVSMADHETWFAAALDDPQRHVLVAEVDGAPVGVVRFDAQSAAQGYVVSLNLAPAARGRGLAAPALDAARVWLAAHDAGAQRLLARIRPDNERSVRTFEGAGYVRTGEADGLLHYERDVASGS